MNEYSVARWWNGWIVYWNTVGLLADKDFPILLWQAHHEDGSIKYMYGNHPLMTFSQQGSESGEHTVSDHRKDKSTGHNMEHNSGQESISGGGGIDTTWANNARESQAHPQHSADGRFIDLGGTQHTTQLVNEGLAAVKSTLPITEGSNYWGTVDTAGGLDISVPTNPLRGSS